MKKNLISLFLIILFCQAIYAQTTEFTYQGRLVDGSLPANGNYDFEFKQFDVQTGGTQIGPTNSINSVAVTNGGFTVRLDFGSVFGNGTDRFLEINVRQTGGGAFTPLTPRQPITSTPYAQRSRHTDTANQANNSANFGGFKPVDFAFSNDQRLSDARNPLPGSVSYIQNRTTQQASTDFNISGTGTANILNVATQYNLGNSRILSSPGTANTFVGIDSGISNNAGGNPQAARDNSFFGYRAGTTNTVGSSNTFFGTQAGEQNLDGTGNTFVGARAGQKSLGQDIPSSRLGSFNSFFGADAGAENLRGDFNSYFGFDAGNANTISNGNTMIGTGAGRNSTGSANTFLGAFAGDSNINGGGNTLIGRSTDVASPNLSNATAIGRGAIVTASNTIQLGTSSDTVRIGMLGTGGNINLCLNSSNEISSCSSPLTNPTKNPSRDQLTELRILVTKQNEIINQQISKLTQQSEKIQKQAEELEALKLLVCSQNQTAEICTNKEKR